MGKLRGRKILWAFGVIAFFLFLLVFGGGKYFAQKFMEELKTHYHISVAVEEITPLFLGFSLKGVSVKGEQFSFQASRLLARLSWKKGISLVIVDGEFSLSQGLAVSLESLPPFFLEVRGGRFLEIPDFRWDGWLEKAGKLFRFSGTSGDLSLTGNIEGEIVTVSGTYRTSPLQGTFSLGTGAFSGTFGEVHFEGVLSQKEDAWQIAPFLVTVKGGTFSGKCVLQKNTLFDLSGMVHVFGMEVPLVLSGYLAFPVFEGKFQSENLSGDAIVDLADASFRIAVHPHSVWRGYRVSGVLEGCFRDDFTVEFRNFSVDVLEENVSFTLSGRLKRQKETWHGNVKLCDFRGTIGGWEFYGGELVARLDGQRVSFSGMGKLLGGLVSLSGEYEGGKLRAWGKAQGIPIERIVVEKSLPLSGTVSANFSLEGERGNCKVFFSLVDGHLFFEGIDLGSIVSGEVESEGNMVALKNLLLVQGGGKFCGTLVKNALGIQGEGVFEAYPLEFSWQERKTQLLLSGTVVFRWGAERFLSFDLSVPLWSFGTFEGRDLRAIGRLQNEEVSLEHLSLLWDGGFLKVRGNLVPGERIDLEGEIENLHVPENDFQVSGVIERAYLFVSGPWENVRWTLKGKGSLLRTTTLTLGKEVTLELAGRVSLSRVLESQSPVLEVLHPEYLEKGIIAVCGVNPALFGGGFFSRTLGTFDMNFVLDPQKGLWHFSSDTIAFSFPPYGSFRGEVRGTYDGQCFALESVKLEGEKGITLSGKGNVDIAAKNLDLWVSGKVEALFPFEGYDINLKAEGAFHVFGDLTFPSWEGLLQAHEVRISAMGRELVLFEDLQGKVLGNALYLFRGKGTFLGGKLTKVEGTVTPDSLVLSGDLEGEGSFPGFEEIFQGRWSGKFVLSGTKGKGYTLQGDLVVSQASLDTRKAVKKEMPNFASFSGLFEGFPVSVKLSIILQDTLLVKTDFLHLVLSGGVSLSFEEGKLSLTGRLDVVEGMYDLVACTIPLGGYITFTDFGGYMPELHLEGWKSIQGYDIQVRISGSLSDYRIDFVADPPLLKEEVLSLLFLGDKDAYVALDRVNLAPLLAKAARFLLKKNWTLHLEPFFDAVTFDPLDFSRITFEKRLGKNVAIGYTQNLNGKSAFEVDIDLSKEWSFRFERKENGELEWMFQFATKF